MTPYKLFIPLGVRPLCSVCEVVELTHTSGARCVDPDEREYGNCFNRVKCEVLRRMTDVAILQEILASNCLSLNFTRQSRKVVEERLIQMIASLGAAVTKP